MQTYSPSNIYSNTLKNFTQKNSKNESNRRKNPSTHDSSRQISQPKFSIKDLFRTFFVSSLLTSSDGLTDLKCGAYALTYSSRTTDSVTAIRDMFSSSLVSQEFKVDFNLFWTTQCPDNTQAFNAFLASSEQNPSLVFVGQTTHVTDIFPNLKSPIEVGTSTCLITDISKQGYSELLSLSFSNLKDFYLPGQLEDSNRYLTKPNGNPLDVGELTSMSNKLIQYVIDNADTIKTETNMRNYFETQVQQDFSNIPLCRSLVAPPTPFPSSPNPTFEPTLNPITPTFTGNATLICGAFALRDSIRSVESTENALLLIQSSSLVLDSFKNIFSEFLKTCSPEKALNSFLAFAEKYPQLVFNDTSTRSRNVVSSIKDPVNNDSPTCLISSITLQGYSDLHYLSFNVLQRYYYPDTFEDSNRYLTTSNGTSFSEAGLISSANNLLQYVIQHTNPDAIDTNMHTYFQTQDEYPSIPHCTSTIPSPTAKPTLPPTTLSPTPMATFTDTWGNHTLICDSYSPNLSIRQVPIDDAIASIYTSPEVLGSFKEIFLNFQSTCEFSDKSLNAFVAFSEKFPTLVFTNTSLTPRTLISSLRPPVPIGKPTCLINNISSKGYLDLIELVFGNMRKYIPSNSLENPNRFLAKPTGDLLQIGKELDSIASRLAQYAIENVNETQTVTSTKTYFETQTDFPDIPNCFVKRICPNVFLVEMEGIS